MNREKILVGVALIVFAGAAFLVLFSGQSDSSGEACIKNNCFSVEVASTPEKREHGLMDRTSLLQDHGLLFVFPSDGIYPFWMKNTLIPLDMIWIASDGVIVYIENNAQPCHEDPCRVYNPGKRARYVLEINGGLSEKLNFSVGDKAEIRS